jgi:hypothetical protein
LEAVALRETFKRSDFHRPTPQPVHEAGVVNDAPIADVDAVMRVESAGCDEMGAEWGLLAAVQRQIEGEEALVNAPGAACTVFLDRSARGYGAFRSTAIARWYGSIRWDWSSRFPGPTGF